MLREENLFEAPFDGALLAKRLKNVFFAVSI